MKFLAVAVLFAFVAVAAAQGGAGMLTREQIQNVNTRSNECLKETGAAEEAIRALIKGDDSQVDGKVKCYAKCMQDKLGFVENGKVNEERVQNILGKLIGEEKAKATQAKCNGLKGTDECDTAYQIRQCYSTGYNSFVF